MRDLTDAIVWITGAGTGMGAATAERLAAAGCRVVLSGRRAEPLREVAGRIAAAGGRAQVELVDVADRAVVEAAHARIVAALGAVDILVNNAGVNIPKRHWPDLAAEDWEQVVAIDLNGPFYCTRAVLPGMRAKGAGLIVNVSSWAGRTISFVAGPAYVAAKHALSAMTETLNLEECINGIRACAICPGEVATPILDQRPVPVSAEDRARMVQPEDIAAAVHFVAAMPAHVCINELVISPTWNRGYVRQHAANGAG